MDKLICSEEKMKRLQESVQKTVRHWNVNLHVGTRGRVRGSPKSDLSSGDHECMKVQNFMTIQVIVVEILPWRPKWWTDQSRHHHLWSFAARLATNRIKNFCFLNLKVTSKTVKPTCSVLHNCCHVRSLQLLVLLYSFAYLDFTFTWSAGS